MHESARQVVLSLLDKPDRDVLKIGNWHPLSMLNSDYKIYTKALANRLNKVLPYLIHSDQVGFMKGRSAADNILDLNAVINYSCETNEPIILFSNDFEKAYDKIEHDSLMEILKCYGFGERFLEMVQIAHDQLYIRVSNAGYMSNEPFRCTRSTLQGCPLSCSKFLLVMECCALKIRQNDNIVGIQIGDESKKVGLFADDLWATFVGTQDVYSEFLFELTEFGDFTGLKPNYDKTEIMRLGSLRNTDAKFYSTLPLKWSDGPLKILGVYVTPDSNEAIELNYSSSSKKAQNVLQMWQSREPSLMGKIQICNSLVSSLFVYKMQTVASPSAKWFDDYSRMIREFLWNGIHKTKIRYHKLINGHEYGGLKLVDLSFKNVSLKLKWLRNFDENESFWASYLRRMFYVNNPFQGATAPGDVKKSMRPSIFRDMVLEWFRINFPKIRVETFNDVLKQNLWCNSFITSNYQWLKPTTFSLLGINKVVDIVNLDNGQFYTWNELKENYNIMDNGQFMFYRKIIASIPRTWKRIIKANLPSNPTYPFYEEFINKYKNTKEIYIYLRDLDQENTQNSLKLLWEIDLRINIPHSRWRKAQFNSFKISISVKLRYFQYRIINRLLYTNMRASKWIQGLTNQCTFCGNCCAAFIV